MEGRLGIIFLVEVQEVRIQSKIYIYLNQSYPGILVEAAQIRPYRL